ncbi:MAG TPA: acetylxylan esterase, partial [Saprospiraceae bacterium]|nr:acetylxylan esterase [Saprospiraceae bacterium]
MNRLLLLVAGLMVSYNVFSQFPTQRERDSLNRLSAEDHREMMLLLHIDSLRQGANGNDMNAPNAVNYEEAKANPFPELPNPLVFKNGKTVSTPADWMKRKLEIREDFEREIYGRIPNKFPAVDWIIVKQRDTMIGEHAALMQKLIGHVDNSSFPEISVDMDLT